MLSLTGPVMFFCFDWLLLMFVPQIENLQEQLRDKEKQMSSLKERVKSLQADTSNTDTALTTLEESLAEKVNLCLHEVCDWCHSKFVTIEQLCHACVGCVCDNCLILNLHLGAHHRASKGATRQRWPREDGGARLQQEGTERAEGETEFTAGRPVRQRGEKQFESVWTVHTNTGNFFFFSYFVLSYDESWMLVVVLLHLSVLKFGQLKQVHLYFHTHAVYMGACTCRLLCWIWRSMHHRWPPQGWRRTQNSRVWRSLWSRRRRSASNWRTSSSE